MNSGVFPLELQKKIGNNNIADTHTCGLGLELNIWPINYCMAIDQQICNFKKSSVGYEHEATS
jgi:hypothetical protein